MLFKVLGVGLVTVVLTLVVKQYRPEYALIVSVCGALIIFFMSIMAFEKVINEVFNLAQLTGIHNELLTPIIKVIGVGYVTEFVCDVAEDAGNKLLANKILLGGKIAILVIAIPIVKNLINTIMSIIL